MTLVDPGGEGEFEAADDVVGAVFVGLLQPANVIAKAANPTVAVVRTLVVGHQLLASIGLGAA